MMKMDNRDSAECQNWEKKDINVIFGKFNEGKKTKIAIVLLLQIKRQRERQWAGDGFCRGWFCGVLE